MYMYIIATVKKTNSETWFLYYSILGASLVAQLVKNLPAMQVIPIQFLGQKDPLEKEMPTHSNILAWRIRWSEEPDRLQSVGSQELDMT